MKNKGFTLVEVLVVSIIVGILSAVAIPALNGYIDRSSDQVCQHTASMVLKSVIAFIQDRDMTLTKLTPGVHRDIDALNTVLGNFRIMIPEYYSIDVFVTDAEHITVFIQDDIHMGSASIGS